MENTTMRNCSSCGKPIAMNAAFCGFCGNRVVEAPTVKYCPSCGEALEPNAAFCANCGNRLAGQQTSPPVLQQVPPQNQQQVPVEKKKKKRGCLIAVGVIVFLFFVLVIAAIRNGGEISFSTVNISEACMASEVNPATSEPLVKTDVFPVGSTTIIYATALVRNVSGSTKISAIWYHLPSDSNIKSENDLVTDKDMWAVFNLSFANGFPVGPYKVEILLDDKVEKTLDFKVE